MAPEQMTDEEFNVMRKEYIAWILRDTWEGIWGGIKMGAPLIALLVGIDIAL